MPSKYYIDELGYAITDDPELADHGEHYSQKIEDILEKAYFEVQKKRPGYLPKLLKLIEKYPTIPTLKNYLVVYYHQLNKPDKAFELNRKIVEKHPGYLHGRLNLAAKYLTKKEYDKIPEIIGESLDLKALYPQRKVFHVNEVEGFMHMVCRYLIATDRLDEANDLIGMMEDILPETTITTNLRVTVGAKRLQTTSAHFQDKQNYREVHPIGKSYDKEIQTDEPPQLYHPELTVLYEQGLRISADTLRQLLALPRETLVADLGRILWDSVRRYEHFYEEMEQRSWDENRDNFMMHALFLLTELRADDQLPLLLDVLRQGHDYLDFWYADHIFETWWHFIYQLGGEQLDVLYDFMLERDIHYFGKNVVSETVKQIGLHQPDRLPEVLQWFESILTYFLDHLDDPLLIDIEVISNLIAEISELDGAEGLLPLIRSCYDLELVDQFLVGTYDDLERDILKGKKYTFKSTVFDNIFDHYHHIVTTWYGYTSKKEQETKLAAPETGKAVVETKQSKPPTSRSSLPGTVPKKMPLPKVGRNAPCPCGSGKKYKHCCLKKSA